MNDDAPRGRWPDWLEPLRPDDLSRARMRRAIARRAAPILQRRNVVWSDVASGWASRLAPLAVAVLLLFGWIAWRAEPVETRQAASLDAEALIRRDTADSPPRVLTSDDAPSADAILASAVYGGGR